MNGLSFLVTDLEISFEDASLRCGIVWLVGLFSVCGIPYCSAPTLPILPTLPISYFLSSTHSLATSTPPSPCCSSPWPRHTCSHPSWSGCQNICRAVSVVKIFSTWCTHTGRSRRGRNSIGIVCGLSADKWVSDPSLWMPGESATTTTQGPRTRAEYVVLDRRNLSAYLS